MTSTDLTLLSVKTRVFFVFGGSAEAVSFGGIFFRTVELRLSLVVERLTFPKLRKKVPTVFLRAIFSASRTPDNPPDHNSNPPGRCPCEADRRPATILQRCCAAKWAQERTANRRRQKAANRRWAQERAANRRPQTILQRCCAAK